MFGLDDAIGAALRIVDKIIPDPQAKAAAALEAVKLKQAGDFKEIDAAIAALQMQSDVNKIQAGSDRLFIAGPRPFIMWICGFAMGAKYFVVPVMAWMSPVFGWPLPPEMDFTELWPILIGMLGIGGMRSYEKIKGVA